MILPSMTVTLLFKALLAILISIESTTAKGTKHVTCGSVFKLMNVNFNVKLHSHNIKYSWGSGQQSVIGTDVLEDGNSYWLIKAEHGKQCTRGMPIKCGDIVRLEHTATKKNLHSHLVTTPFSSMQEVSAYGDYKGEGDTGDNWKLICQTDFWKREDLIMLKHVDTHVYLGVSGKGNPIGQIEVVGDNSPRSQFDEWKTMEGLFIHPADFKAHHYEHTEL